MTKSEFFSKLVTMLVFPEELNKKMSSFGEMKAFSMFNYLKGFSPEVSKT